MYKTELLESTEADGDNGILKNAIISVSLKYLSNFGKSLEMPLINCKVELKLKRTNYCVLSAACADNVSNRDDRIIFTINDTKLYVPVVTLSAERIKNYQIFLAKDLKDQFIRMNIIQKAMIKR